MDDLYYRNYIEICRENIYINNLYRRIYFGAFVEDLFGRVICIAAIILFFAEEKSI